ncbi:MAG: OmpA family protein [Ignavibacteria bacterium]|nr:OmpA family protein [Ignavibacteria bacterium]
MNRLKHHHEIEGSTGADRYLLTYADLITLLLGLFVILYASAQVDTGKYKEFSAAMTDYFKPTGDKQPHSDKILPGTDGIPQPILPKAPQKTIDQITLEVERSLLKEITNGLVKAERTPDGLKLALPEALLFTSGKADIQPRALAVLDSLAAIFVGIDKQISVDGFTDSIPIRTFQFESNWHLSSERAMNIGYYLLQRGVPEKNFSVRGYGATQAIAPNTSTEGRAKNRRVEIMITELPHTTPSSEGYISDSVSKVTLQ